jgi:hypothetical protein
LREKAEKPAPADKRLDFVGVFRIAASSPVQSGTENRADRPALGLAKYSAIGVKTLFISVFRRAARRRRAPLEPRGNFGYKRLY